MRGSLNGNTRHRYTRDHRSSFLAGTNLEATAELRNSLAHALNAMAENESECLKLKHRRPVNKRYGDVSTTHIASLRAIGFLNSNCGDASLPFATRVAPFFDLTYELTWLRLLQASAKTA